MGASEQFIKENHADIPDVTRVESADQNGDQLREHFETNNLVRACTATSDGPIEYVKNILDNRSVKAFISTAAA